MAKVGQVVWGTGCFSGQWVAIFDTQSLQPAGQIDLGDRFGESLALVDERLWVSIPIQTVEGGQVVTSRTGLALLDPAAHMVARTFELLDGGGPLALRATGFGSSGGRETRSWGSTPQTSPPLPPGDP